LLDDRFLKASEELKKTHGIDVVGDILLGRPDRIYLFAERAPLERMRLRVISGSLSLIGFPDADAIAMKEILARFDPDNRYADVAGRKEYYDYVYGELTRPTGEPNVTFPLLHEGKRFWIHVLMSPVYRHPDCYSVFITDVTSTMVAEERNHDRSHRDSLTGLFNKYTLDYHYGLRYRNPGFHAFYLDLDDFKSVNDHCGHVVGDAFLRSFSDILKSHEHDDTLFYRLGGDEFIGMLFGSEGEMRGIAADILAKTRAIRIPGMARIPSVSIGIVRAERGDDVIHKADKVMYEVKNAGKDGFKYLTESEFDARDIRI